MFDYTIEDAVGDPYVCLRRALHQRERADYSTPRLLVRRIEPEGAVSEVETLLKIFHAKTCLGSIGRRKDAIFFKESTLVEFQSRRKFTLFHLLIATLPELLRG